jgi:hypothetical protein
VSVGVGDEGECAEVGVGARGSRRRKRGGGRWAQAGAQGGDCGVMGIEELLPQRHGVTEIAQRGCQIGTDE